MGISKSSEALDSIFEERIGKTIPSWVPMTGSDSWILAKYDFLDYLDDFFFLCSHEA